MVVLANFEEADSAFSRVVLLLVVQGSRFGVKITTTATATTSPHHMTVSVRRVNEL